MKNTMIQIPKLPQLPDTPVLNYAKSKQAKRLLAEEQDKLMQEQIDQAWAEEEEDDLWSQPRKEAKHKIPVQQTGSEQTEQEAERVRTEERIRRLQEQIARTQEQDKLLEDQFLDGQIDRAWTEEEKENEIWSSRPRGRTEQMTPAPVQLPQPALNNESEEERLDRLIDEAWYEDDEYGPPKQPNWKKMLAHPEKTGYDDLNGSLQPRTSKTDDKAGPQNAIMTAEEAENARIVPLPDYDLSEPELMLLSSSGGGYLTLDGRRVDTMAEKIEADALYRLIIRGESADSIADSPAGSSDSASTTLDVTWETQFIPYKDSYDPNVRWKDDPTKVGKLCQYL